MDSKGTHLRINGVQRCDILKRRGQDVFVSEVVVGLNFAPRTRRAPFFWGRSVSCAVGMSEISFYTHAQVRYPTKSQLSIENPS